MDVLKWLAQGKSREETSIILGIGLETVKTHAKSILQKLEVQNTAGAITRACLVFYATVKHYPKVGCRGGVFSAILSDMETALLSVFTVVAASSGGWTAIVEGQ